MDIKQLYDLYQQHPCITTDSRNCPKDSIFLALKGASFDGNKFAKTAFDKGCAYAIIAEPAFAEADNDRLILVDDWHHRDQWKDHHQGACFGCSCRALQCDAY